MSILQMIKKAIEDNIAAAIGLSVAGAALTGAASAWVVLKQWAFVEVPSGVVVASTVECRDMRGGWVAFEEGNGRFIVGAGSPRGDAGLTKSYEAFTIEGAKPRANFEKSIGGKESHLLAEPELPPHSHEVYRHASGEIREGGGNPGAGWVEGAGSGDRATFVKDNRQTGITGKGVAIAMIPPYVALHYCKKK